MTLGEIIKVLTRIYCEILVRSRLHTCDRWLKVFILFKGKDVGIQYVHIPDKNQCDWIRKRVELPQPWNYSVEEKRMILDRLMWSDSFESFIASKFPNEKRFGLEGCESLIPGMKAMIDKSVDQGVKSVVMGMPHRGRLNVLANVIRKPIEAILNEL